MVGRKDGLSREFIIHPGETLKEILEDRGMSQRELALRTDVKEPHVSGIVNCQKPISVSFAKKLEYALGVDSSFWINLQANYEKELADFEEIHSISNEEMAVLQILKPITDYAQSIRLLESQAQGSLRVIEWRKLLNVSSLLRIPQISQSGAYRLAATKSVDPYILFAWLRLSDLIAKDLLVKSELSVEKLTSMLPLIRGLAFESEETMYPKLKGYLADCGIRFAIMKHFTGAPVQGVIKTNIDATLNLTLTLRQKFADIFWFTLFHEIGHIVHGDVKGRLIDYVDIDNEMEQQADEFAENALIDRDCYSSFVNKGVYSLERIQQFSEEMQIPSFITIGRLQHDKHMDFRQYVDEKPKYDLNRMATQ